MMHGLGMRQAMAIDFVQLGKLRGRSIREMRVRVQQELFKLGERLLGATEMSDGALWREIAPASRNGSEQGTAALIAARMRALITGGMSAGEAWTFFPSLAQRQEIVAQMNTRFAPQRRAMIERADRAIAGRFDLLGFKDLSFGNPIDWLLEPISGWRAPLDHWSRFDQNKAPAGCDLKIVWELNRHAHFVTLGQAYWLTGDERYAEAFVGQASAWMDANPLGLGINWVSSLEMAFRVISWLWALHLFAASPCLDDPFFLRALKFLTAHGRHIESYLSYYFSPNTHLTGEALGLFYLGMALPELRRARTWRETGLRILLNQLRAQVRGDGVYFEQASYYHRYTADFYTHLVALAEVGGVILPGDVRQRLVMLLDHLMWMTRPDGTSPLIGDDDGGRLIALAGRAANDFRDTLATGASLFGRGDWKHVAGNGTAEMLWLLGPEGLKDYDAITAYPPDQLARGFRESGYFVMRDGWTRESSYLLMDCGPHGAEVGCGHAHADALSFEFAAGGVTWLVDPGTYSYADPQVRNDLRSTAAHNTATVDNESQSEPKAAFGWGATARSQVTEFKVENGTHTLAGWHDGYERLADPVSHSRQVRFIGTDAECGLPAHLILRDDFAARGRHRYTLRFHFAADCSATVDGRLVCAIAPDGSQLTICPSSSMPLRVSVAEDWVSECYGQRVKAPVAVIEAEGEGAQHFNTMLIPSTPAKHSTTHTPSRTKPRTKEEAPA